VLRFADSQQKQIVLQMMEKEINCPRTSSLGRLFDAVAAIVGLRGRVAFEGQAAIELEAIADSTETGRYASPWQEQADGVMIIPSASIIRSVVKDLCDGRPPAIISARFHNTLVALFDDLCRELRGRTGIEQVALSGGVFQSDRMLSGLSTALANSGFEVLTHRIVPANDGGISLGQAVVAAAQIQTAKENNP
jgi:hydrogenase maturation protein HypF